MGISEYRALIKKAQEEIEKCNRLISKITTVTGSLNKCSIYLRNVSSNLDAGLKIDGASVDSNGNISIRTGKIVKYCDRLSLCISVINNRIQTLKNNIDSWNAEIERIEAEERAKEEMEKKRTWYYQ